MKTSKDLSDHHGSGKPPRPHMKERDRGSFSDQVSDEVIQRRVYVGGKWANTWNYLQFCNSSHYIMNDNNKKC